MQTINNNKTMLRKLEQSIIAFSVLLIAIFLLPTTSKAQNYICPGESYTLTAQAGLTNYQWYTITAIPDTVAIAGATLQTYTATAAGTYIYKAKDANLCTVTLCTPMVITTNPCCKPNAGADQTTCAGTSITAIGTVPSTGTWSAQAGNPVGATVGTTTAGVSIISFGTNASGNYYFIYNIGSTCNDTMMVTVKPITTSSTPVTVCSNQLPYIWNGTNYNTVGTYTYTTMNAAGCDSVATLVLNINNTSTSSTPVTVCSNQLPYTWNGTNYNTAGTYTYTTMNAAGCDSVATLVLNINNTSTSSTPVTVCSNQLPYTWNGTNYNTAGTYTYTTMNAAGCDSVATLVLNINNTSTSSTPVTVCSNQLPYSWNGTNYNTAGTYTYTTMNAAGCDSVATLVLNINITSTSSTPVTVCSNQLPYTWNGTNYNTAGTYTYTTNNAAGCDSVATLVLNINNTSTSSTPVTVCSNQLPYSWNGTNYNTAGTYTYTTMNAAGCDSVATLVLNINNTTTSSTPVTVCSNQLPYSWNGTNYNTAGTYTYTTNNAAGCDSVATLVLTITPFGTIGNYVWFDFNHNGQNDEAAGNGINGITVELYKETTPGNYVLDQSTTTAVNGGNSGYYQFEVCASGNYKVKFPLTNGVNALTLQTNTAVTNNNSDPSMTTGYTDAFSIDVNGTGTDKDNMTIDAGYQFVCPTPNCGTGTIIKN